MIYFTFDSGEGNGDLLQKYFNRYDFEGSGYINCGEELMHLCTNVCCHWRITLRPDDIQERLLSVTAEEMDYEHFHEWFGENFPEYIYMQ